MGVSSHLVAILSSRDGGGGCEVRGLVGLRRDPRDEGDGEDSNQDRSVDSTSETQGHEAATAKDTEIPEWQEKAEVIHLGRWARWASRIIVLLLEHQTPFKYKHIHIVWRLIQVALNLNAIQPPTASHSRRSHLLAQAAVIG